MKVEWEEKDIKTGRRFRSEFCNEIWMIGGMTGDNGTEFTVVSTLDGLVNTKLKTRKDVAEFLNRNNDLPLELLDESWIKEVASQ